MSEPLTDEDLDAIEARARAVKAADLDDADDRIVICAKCREAYHVPRDLEDASGHCGLCAQEALEEMAAAGLRLLVEVRRLRADRIDATDMRARAVEIEREACARIAEQCSGGDDTISQRRLIASRIRERSAPQLDATELQGETVHGIGRIIGRTRVPK